MSGGAQLPVVSFVVGARPNFVKAAPVLDATLRRGFCDPHLIHTGQHYDRSLSQLFFEDLAIPEPHLRLAVGGGSHAEQTARVMVGVEAYLKDSNCCGLVVFGDVNSTVGASLSAAKLGIPIAHVESGLRSFDRSMPEEINRVVTDTLSDILFTTEESGTRHLRQAGVPRERIFFVGNTMIDSLLRFLPAARRLGPGLWRRFAVEPRAYSLLTLHRPSNVDQNADLERILGAVAGIGRRIPVIFPVHPRTRQALERHPSCQRLLADEKVLLHLTEPLGYLEFISLMDSARLVLTDSGGIQEETTALGVPCLTLRDNTERPVTLEEGSNCLVGTDGEAILAAAHQALDTPWPSGEPRRPKLWDGCAAERVVDVLARHWGSCDPRLAPTGDAS